jgi:hypothetical protein
MNRYSCRCPSTGNCSKTSWYPERQAVSVEADEISIAQPAGSSRTGVFFSGGVDSFFTTLHFDKRAAEESLPPIDDLITVWGFDIPIDNALAFDRVRRNSSRIASQLQKELVIVKTNARETRLSQMAWLSHFGSLLAGLALSLEGRYAKILISSAEGHRYQKPISGSHPQTDPLLSTSDTAVIHYGQDHDRFQRTALISNSAIAMDALRVCWESAIGVNCGQCDKCYRTMATLDILGCLPLCSTLPADEFDVRRLEGIYSSNQRAYYLSLREHAYSRGRDDIAEAIDRSLARSNRIDSWTQLPMLLRANQKLKSSSPFLWRLIRPIRSAMKALLKRATGASI